MTTYYYSSPISLLSIEYSEQGIARLAPASVVAPDVCLVPDDCREWLDAYFEGDEPSHRPRLDLRGTAFQQVVWDELLRLPYGTTITYGALAQRVAERQRCTYSTLMARAVAQAVGRNPVCIMVPCHRVVGSSNIGGYRYGVSMKEHLLCHERSHCRLADNEK